MLDAEEVERRPEFGLTQCAMSASARARRSLWCEGAPRAAASPARCAAAAAAPPVASRQTPAAAFAPRQRKNARSGCGLVLCGNVTARRRSLHLADPPSLRWLAAMILSSAQLRGARGTFVPRVFVLVFAALTAFALTLTLPSSRSAALYESVERHAPDWAVGAINLGTGLAKWSGTSCNRASGWYVPHAGHSWLRASLVQEKTMFNTTFTLTAAQVCSRSESPTPSNPAH